MPATAAAGIAPAVPLLQAVILRTDLRIGRVPMLAFAARAALAFIVARSNDGARPSLTTAEAAWLRGSQARVHLRVDDEAELHCAVDRARAAGLPLHLIVSHRRVLRVSRRVSVCCAVGPADAQQVAAVTGHLAPW